MKIGLLAFTDKAKSLAARIKESCGGELINTEELQNSFHNYDAFIFVGAAGIAVRLIKDLIVSKDNDPAVLVCDELGNYVVPLLSGHIGGANRLAHMLHQKLGMAPVITTATDLNGIFAVDAWGSENGYITADIAKIKNISAALLKGESVGFYSAFGVEGDLPEGLFFANSGSLGITVSYDQNLQPFDISLNLIPGTITLGAGCKKGTSPDAFEAFVREHFPPTAIKRLATIDLKKDEPALKSFAEKYHCEFITYSAGELEKAEGSFVPSDFVKSVTGVDNVCERAAALAGEGEFILPKTAKEGMTLAATAPAWRVVF